MDFDFHPVFEGGPEGAEEAHLLDFSSFHAVGEAFARAHGEGEDGEGWVLVAGGDERGGVVDEQVGHVVGDVPGGDH